MSKGPPKAIHHLEIKDSKSLLHIMLNTYCGLLWLERLGKREVCDKISKNRVTYLQEEEMVPRCDVNNGYTVYFLDSTAARCT